MARLDITVEINDGSVLEALAEVREKQRELNNAVSLLEGTITGRHAESVPHAAVVIERPRM